MLGRPVEWVSQPERGLVPTGSVPVPGAVLSELAWLHDGLGRCPAARA
jgi:hypothetical protein